MAFKLDLKTVSKFLFKIVKFIIKKILTILLWIFLIIIFIALAATGERWQAAGFVLVIALVYVIKFLRMKLKENKSSNSIRGVGSSSSKVELSKTTTTK